MSRDSRGSYVIILAVVLVGIALYYRNDTRRYSPPLNSAPVPTARPALPKRFTEFAFQFNESILTSTSGSRTRSKELVFGPLSVSVKMDQVGAETTTAIRGSVNGELVFSKVLDQQPLSVAYVPATRSNAAMVAVTSYSGGAHCCFKLTVIDASTGNQTVRQTADHEFGNVSPRWEAVSKSGPYVLIGGDDSIAYQFASYAGTSRPIELWAVQNWHFKHVTGSYPLYVSQDFEAHEREWKKFGNLPSRVSSIADLLVLGRKSEAAILYSQIANVDQAPAIRDWLTKHGYGDPVSERFTAIPAPVIEPPAGRENKSAGSFKNESTVGSQTSADCENESVSTVAEDGSFIGTLEGGKYIVDEIDRIDTQLWLVTDDVTVCDGDGIKLIHDGEIAHAHRISG